MIKTLAMSIEVKRLNPNIEFRNTKYETNEKLKIPATKLRGLFSVEYDFFKFDR